jgi:DNA-binding IscR family transcriptional regulator
VAGVVLVLAALGAGAIILATSSPSLTAGPDGLATLGMPTGGGTIEHVSVLAGEQSVRVPVVVHGNQIWPRKTLPAGERLSIQAVVRRPGWMSWLTGSTQRVTLTTVTPSSSIRSRFLTVHRGQPLQVAFDRPVRVVEYGSVGALHRRVLSTAATRLSLPRSSSAGSIMVAGTPYPWERAAAEPVSWFPAGLVRASAVATPSPGTRLTPDQPINLTFSKPVRSVLKSNPALSPDASGSWRITSSHTLSFRPSGYGYGLGATVKLALPAGVGLVGGHTTAGGSEATWNVPGGSPVRLHQLLAQLGYLPVSFHYSGAAPGPTAQAQLAAAVNPPKGNFTWRWSNVPAALKADWSPTASGVMTEGAIMAFELQKLGKSGFLTAEYGTNGGYRLARDPGRISALEVIRAIDGPIVLANCFTSDSSCGHMSRCTVRKPLRKIHEGILRLLESVSIQDMLQEGDEVQPAIPPSLIALRGAPNSFESPDLARK